MNRIKLSGLWRNVDKNGNTYYAGSLSPGVRLLVFKNNFKKEDREPDLVLYIAPAEKREEGSSRDSNG